MLRARYGANPHAHVQVDCDSFRPDGVHAYAFTNLISVWLVGDHAQRSAQIMTYEVKDNDDTVLWSSGSPLVLVFMFVFCAPKNPDKVNPFMPSE